MASATTTVAAGGTALISVEYVAEIVRWLGLHYAVTPEFTELTTKAVAVVFLATVGTVVYGVWWTISRLVRATIEKWAKKHHLDINSGSEPVQNP